MEIKLTKEAVDDLEQVPLLLRPKIIANLEYLSQNPLLGFKMERAFKGFRCLLAGKQCYRIIYKIDQKIIVYYIRHTRRQIGLRIVSY